MQWLTYVFLIINRYVVNVCISIDNNNNKQLYEKQFVQVCSYMKFPYTTPLYVVRSIVYTAWSIEVRCLVCSPVGGRWR